MFKLYYVRNIKFFIIYFRVVYRVLISRYLGFISRIISRIRIAIFEHFDTIILFSRYYVP